jgi:hypothetical protein
MSTNIASRFRIFRRNNPVIESQNRAYTKAVGRRDSLFGTMSNVLKGSIDSHLRYWAETSVNDAYGIQREFQLRDMPDVNSGGHCESITIRFGLVGFETQVRITTLSFLSSAPGGYYYGESNALYVHTPEEAVAIARALSAHVQGKQDPKFLTTESVAEILRVLPRHELYYRTLQGKAGYEFAMPTVTA